MSEMSQNDNTTNSVADSLPVASCSFEVQDPDQTLLAEGGADDFFVCRKCNKIFNNISQYVEHKVKEENYRLEQTRSKADQRMVLPRLIEKPKRKAQKTERANKKLKTQQDVEKTSGQTGTVTQDEQGVNNTASTDTNTLDASSRASYSCSECNQTFKREAALKWHQSRFHKSRDSEDSDDEAKVVFNLDADIKGYYADFSPKNNGDNPEKQAADHKERAEPTKQHIFLSDNQASEDGSMDKIVDPSGISDKSDGGGAEPCKSDGKAVGVSASTDKIVVFSKESKDSQKAKKLHICDVCGKGFKEHAQLKAHGLVHTDERKFKCEVDDCPYAFKSKGGLVRHMRRHTGDRPFKCERCGRCFSESGALSRHMRARRDCAAMSDKAYPRYKKSWNFHPNIPAVADPSVRDPQRGRSLLDPPADAHTLTESKEIEGSNGEIHYIITELLDGSVDVVTVASPQTSVHVDASAVRTDARLVGSGLADMDPDGSIHEAKGVENPAAAKVVNVEIVGDPKTNINQMVGEETGCTRSSEVVITPTLPTSRNMPNLTTSAQSDSTSHKEFESEKMSKLEATQPVAMTTVGATTSGSDLSLENTYNEIIRAEQFHGDNEFLGLGPALTEDSSEHLQCQVCHKDFKALEGLEIHLRTHLADEPSKCGLCHFTAQGREELRQHILTMHQKSLNDIEASVLSVEIEDDNLKKDETVDSMKTTLRNALTAVKQLYSIKKHRKTPSYEKPDLSTTGYVQCMVCNKYVRGMSYLRQHMRTHTGDRPFQCQDCGRSFTSRDILKKHMYVHQKHRDYKCGECGKLFKRLSHVQQHLRSHNEERAFRCSICDKTFKTQHSLKVHLRTHSGINPYKCEVCNSHFRERGSLQRHMRLHTGEKPFKCHLCNRAFSEHGTLARHLKAKVPCTSSRDIGTRAGRQNLSIGLSQSGSMLAQFSSVVAGSEHMVLPPGGASSEHMVLPPGADLQHEGDAAAATVSQQEFLVPAVQAQETGPEYVVLQSNVEDSDIIESVVSSDFDGSKVEMPAVYMHEQTAGSETLHLVDSSTGEAVLIMADKSIVELVKEQHLALQASGSGCDLAKIEEILAGVQDNVASSQEAIAMTDMIKEEITDADVDDQGRQLEIVETEHVEVLPIETKQE